MVLRHVAIDVETSGLSPYRGGRVIEVAAVEVLNGKTGAEFSSLVNVPCRIHHAARRVHGISGRALMNAPTPDTVWPNFLDFVGRSTLIAHNAVFDLSFIRHEFSLLGLFLTNRNICTLRLSRRLLPELSNHSLESVAGHLLGEIPEDCRLHRALGDARLAARIWLAMNGM